MAVLGLVSTAIAAPTPVGGGFSRAIEMARNVATRAVGATASHAKQVIHMAAALAGGAPRFLATATNTLGRGSARMAGLFHRGVNINFTVRGLK